MKTKFLFLLGSAMFLFTSCNKEPKKEMLFNGENLDGWVSVIDANANPADTAGVFSVKEGNIYVKGQPFGYLRTEKKYQDYNLHVEFRWVGEPTNSGVFQRVQDGDRVWCDAIECQLWHGHIGDYVMLGNAKIEEVDCTNPFSVKERVCESEKPAGEWNELDVTCVGKKVYVKVNGVEQNECTGEHTEGYIALQSEGGPLEFRNIYVTPITVE